MPEENIYRCDRCLNESTVVCEFCGQIKSPSGKKNKPTYYLEDKSGSREGRELTELTARIVIRLMYGNPIRVAWVNRYNELITSEEE